MRLQMVRIHRLENVMDNSELLITAMAAKCREVISHIDEPAASLPKPLRPSHLCWMCDQIEINAEDWPATKLHRWIGFVQCGLLANHLLDLNDVRRMFDEAKVAHAESSEDLLDHLDSRSGFEFELGGEG